MADVAELGKKMHELRQISEKALRSAAARALNRAATSARAEAARRVQDSLNLKVSDIKNAIDIDTASAREDLSTMKASLIVKNIDVPLYQYGARQKTIRTSRGKRYGVTVNVKGSRTVEADAFIAQMPSGHIGIFVRSGNPRLPIHELYSTTVLEVFKNTGFVASLSDYASQQFQTNFASELAYQLSKVS